MGKIQYDPEKSIEEICSISGVKKPTVWKYIRDNFIDREYDSQLIIYRRVQQYFKENPDSSFSAAAVVLSKDKDGNKIKGYSRNTVQKYSKKENAPKPNGNKIFLSVVSPTMSKATVASVSNEDSIILGIILRSLLKDDDRFDCDLTFSKGDFYRYGVQYPRHCFDLYPEQPSHLVDPPEVKKLEEGYKLPDNSLSSVVIDLPQNISDNGIRTPDAFADITDLAVSYYELLKLAYQKLRYISETQSGGLLLIKVGDIIWQGKMLWMSKIVTELATGRRTRISEPVYEALKSEAERRGHTVEEEFPLFDMELVDKYIHTYDTTQIESQDQLRHSIKAHDYFLVFSKGYESIDSDTFYYGSDFPLYDKGDMMRLASDAKKLGPKVESRKSRAEGNYVYAVKVPLATDDNHIDENTTVSTKIKELGSKELGYRIVGDIKGKEFIEKLKSKVSDMVLADPDFKSRDKTFYEEVNENLMKLLRKIGVKFIQSSSNSKRHWEDCNRIIIDPSAIEIREIESIWS